MPESLKFEKINAVSAVSAVNATLRRIDERLVDHGERVAYIACELCRKGKLDLDMKSLFLLSVFHDIGAYKTDEIDRMVEFETTNVWNHSIYGYLFLKYMTPLKSYAEAILYHHSPWETIKDKDNIIRNYAALIHLADRMDMAIRINKDSQELTSLLENSKGIFCDDYVDIIRNDSVRKRIIEELSDGSYHKRDFKMCLEFEPNATETLEYLKMVVYSIDFRSEHTVTHTVNTVSLALNIARHFNMEESELEKIYLGALLHDVGKIVIPISILEYPGKLTDEQMAVMRTHVVETKKLIEGIVPDDICLIATRHHEKLDGSGYPCGLTADELTFSQRIVAVADIVSALSSRRSYKEPFPEEMTIGILRKMEKSQLDSKICDYVCDNYLNIVDKTEFSREKVISQYKNITCEYEKIMACVLKEQNDRT